MSTFDIVILAAGEGTRMKSATPKLLHHVAGAPIIAHVTRAAIAAGAQNIGVVTSPNRPEITHEIEKQAPDAQFFTQSEQLGTGHAARMAENIWATGENMDDGHVAFVFGDHPLLTAQAFQGVIAKLAAGYDACVLGFEAHDPTGYGRLITNGEDLTAIVEHKDATPEQLEINLCNACIMGFSKEALREAMPKLQNDNAQGEYYLPDLIKHIVEAGGKASVHVEPEHITLGVNSRRQLADAEMVFQDRLRNKFMDAGVTLRDPGSTYFSFDTEIENDVTVEPNVVIGTGVKIRSGVHVRAFSHLEKATIQSGAIVGPYARLRPGADIGQEAHVGNFTEVKNAKIGTGTKVNHLSYIGDAELGQGSNIGAGTITCNYDGYNKHLTKIGDGVFVGSNTALVAPVNVGDDALIAAGSTITKDLPSGSFGIARTQQTIRADYAEKIRDRAKAIKKQKSTSKSK